VLFGSANKVTGICSERKTRTLAWQVDSLTWQCPCAWCVKSLRVPDKEIHYKNDHLPYSLDFFFYYYS
jgi:hypothetical protein